MSIEAVKSIDPEVHELLRAENLRQRDCLRLIASENYTSAAVLAAVGSVFINKYSEGYPGKRYYQGQPNADAVERLAIARAKEVFGADHANVQPYSGSPANMGAYFALCQPGDTIVGLGLPAGGHLSHGWKVNFSGMLYKAHQYGVDAKTELIDLAQVRALVQEVKPKVLSVGTTAYARQLDFAGFAEIAKEAGAYLIADVAHVAGLIAGGVYTNPVPYADIVTTTTHKTLRGPRGGMILCKQEHAKALDRAVFPGLQGGPHINQIAGLAIALKEAMAPEFKTYATQIVANAKVLGEELVKGGLRLVTGGTDTHLILVDLTPKGVAGRPAADALERAGIVCNCNSIPFDPRKPFDPSGIRLGTPALTTRGMAEDEMKTLAKWIIRVVENVEDEALLAKTFEEVKELAQSFPAPGVELD
ncbi:MAG: serine hydroxymethyltransferase [Myxococcota bacterium]|jgi:glycine hydroxymethyltransferase|nr:serine hydroxymethyltransferase [Myxococcota bacterium]